MTLGAVVPDYRGNISGIVGHTLGTGNLDRTACRRCRNGVGRRSNNHVFEHASKHVANIPSIEYIEAIRI